MSSVTWKKICKCASSTQESSSELCEKYSCGTLCFRHYKNMQMRLVEEMLDKTGTTLETLPRKPVLQMQPQTGTSLFLPQNGIQLHPCVTELILTNLRALIMKQKWVLSTHTFGSVCWGIYPKFILFSFEAWFHLSGYITLYNNSYWSAVILVFVHIVLW